MLTKVPKCNRIAECMADKKCVWDGNPANKDLKCMFFEQKLKAVQERRLKAEHLPEIKRIDAIDRRVAKLQSDKSKRVNALESQVEKVSIHFNTKITRLRTQKEKLLRIIYGSDYKGGTL